MSMKKRYIAIIIGLFIIILTLFRLVWMDMFSNVTPIEIEDGIGKLSDWDARDNQVLLLDGEWEFYPSKWLYDEDGPIDVDDNEAVLLHVPDGWNTAFEEEEFPSFGYGSYRLRLYVDPGTEMNYSMQVPSVRSASEVYINGRLVAGSGEVGTSEETYVPKNVPYTTTVMANEVGEIEIVVQAANFQDIRRSGVIRSIKFGSEAAIKKEVNLSLIMQVLAIGLVAIHAIYAVAIYFLRRRNTRLLYFALFLSCIMLMNLVSNDEKLFHLLFDISYEWDFRLANVIGPLAGYALFKSLDKRLIPYWHIINPIFLSLNIVLGTLIIFSTPEQVISYIPVNGILSSFSIIVTVFVIGRKIYDDMAENMLLLLSFVAIVHNLFWMMYWRETGISVVHYPFDYLIAIGLFTLIWFKEYFNIHAETKRQAIELQMINEHKEQFLANTAHEFKNPLHGMMNMSQAVLMRESGKLELRSTHELNSIVTVGERMSLLLNDLLDVERFKAGAPRLDMHDMNIQPVIQGVLDMLQFTVDMKSVQVYNEVPDDFPPIYADENRVVQVLHNILHNAIKFTDEGAVYIRASIQDERAFIHIKDTGKGIDTDFFERLFKAYEQVESRENSGGGFGLGLSVSKQLIELHGGQLEVTSKLGEGSEFTFSFALSRLNSQDEVASSLLNEEITAENSTNSLFTKEKVSKDLPNKQTTTLDYVKMDSLKRLRVLIVDDDPVNLQVLESILSVEPLYDVTAVLSGEEALEYLNKRDWCLVITDVMMPGMSGYELTKKIRQRYSITELPVLLLTARGTQQDIQTGFMIGANDYVTKPVNRIELLSRVQVLTTLRSAVREQLHLEAIWLQSQIQPHFLFNTLNSLVALSEMDVVKMKELLYDFSDFLRSKFQFHHVDGLVPMEEELNIVKSYLNIEQIRFGDRLEVVWDVDENSMVDIPFLTIQPLVENAINHGVMERLEGGKVIIRVKKEKSHVLVAVLDNGVGIAEEKLSGLLNKRTNDYSSIGLINTNRRILKNFGQGLHIESKVGEGTTVSFVVPI